MRFDPASSVPESTYRRYEGLDGTERTDAIEADAVKHYGSDFPNPRQALVRYLRDPRVNRLYIEAGRQRGAGVAKRQDHNHAQLSHLAEPDALIEVLKAGGLSWDDALGEVVHTFPWWWRLRPQLSVGASVATQPVAKGHDRRKAMFGAVAIELQRALRKSAGAVDVRAELRKLVSVTPRDAA